MIFVQSTAAPKPRTQLSANIALFFAGIVLVMALGQLFSFEKFIPLIESYRLPGGASTALLVACILVTLEVFALPFLLRMQLSKLMRTVSMVAGWLVVTAWLKLALWVNLTVNEVDNIGLFGVHVQLPVGWWAVLFVLALGVQAAWASWGLGSVAHDKKNRS